MKSAAAFCGRCGTASTTASRAEDRVRPARARRGTFAHIQQWLQEGARAPIRKDIDADFPLRGFVACDDCGGPLTSCWSKSSTGKLHPYYLCHTRACVSVRKSIPRDRIEGEFETLLKSLQPSENLFAIMRAMFKQAWKQRQTQGEAIAAGLRKELKDLAAQTNKLLECIVESYNAAVVSAYEKKLSALESRRLVLTEKADASGKPRYAFEDVFELALRFLASPWNLWASGHLQLRRTVLRLAFSERARYRREEGFSNAKIALPFKILEEVRNG